MTTNCFSLQPFPSSSESAPDLTITGQIIRQASAFSLHYEVAGNLSQLAMANAAAQPLRQHELWQTTCFEFFLGPKGAEQYWEFNLSPAGHWNVYRFTSYRQGMQEEAAFTHLPFQVTSRSDKLSLTIEVDLDPLLPDRPLLEVSVTMVIQTLTGGISYWALTHCGAAADFHRRDSFIALL